MTKTIPVITIDGPVGVGKGTLAYSLAKHLRWHLLDSGSIYRALAIAAENHAIKTHDSDRLSDLAAHLDVRFSLCDQNATVGMILQGVDVSEVSRTEKCANRASEIAALPAVRQALLTRQRQFQQAPGLIADGRDMGTVVFPDAKVKFFLNASQAVRANRRYKQLKSKGIDVTLGQVEAQIEQRDKRDSNRAIAPLRAAQDAIVIDTTTLSIHDVFEQVLREVKGRLSL